MPLHPSHRNYLDRVRSQSSNNFTLDNVPGWLEKNTKNPVDSDLWWSFTDHEYQIEILKDVSDDVCAQKCSQVGASELWVRLLLALVALAKNMTAIYVLPTTGFARKFAKGRMDPVISGSTILRNMVNKDVDSSELKQLGNSFIYIAGSYGQNSAISVPAQALFQDEVDFCNQTTLTTFNSRLGHSKPGEFYKRSFSTPTVKNYGISRLFEDSSKAYYTVKCPSCRNQVAPSFLDDVEVPGFEGKLLTFEKEDLQSPKIDVLNAMLRCPDCRGVLPAEVLCDPSKRVWIHKHPDRVKKGYQISPFDVPAINPIARTIAQMSDYTRKKDWVNFKIGVPYEDAENSFVLESIRKMAVHAAFSKPVEGSPRLFSGSVFGLDVGKVSWFTLMIPDQSGRPLVAYAERIRQDGDNYLGKRVLALCNIFGVVRGVVDAQPDISVPKYLIDNAGYGKVWACYYARTAKKNLDLLDFSEEDQIVTAYRTGTFDDLVKRVNSGAITYAKFEDYETHLTHLGAMKKISHLNDSGEEISAWIATAEDHYAHSLNYCTMAWDMRDGVGVPNLVIPCLPGMQKVSMTKIKQGENFIYK